MDPRLVLAGVLLFFLATIRPLSGDRDKRNVKAGLIERELRFAFYYMPNQQILANFRRGKKPSPKAQCCDFIKKLPA